MFTHLISLLLALLAIDMAPYSDFRGWPSTFLASMTLATFLYGITLALIGRLKRPLLMQGALLLFLVALLYVIEFQRFIKFWPETTTTAVALVLYFSGLIVAKSWHFALFYIPFSLPFLLYIFLGELFHPLSESILFFLAFSILLFLFLPVLFQAFWKCQALPPSELKDRLDRLCTQAHFKHGGIKLWTLMRQSVTAAIVGILPRYRYILLTERLIETFTEEEIEAVVAHEMGHWRHYHLILYPCILAGVIVCAAYVSTFLTPLNPLLALLPYALLLYLYLRYVFGFFSRAFERQADLHVFALSVAPAAMVSALLQVAKMNGHSTTQPSWHHGSIRSRVEYIERSAYNPKWITQHHRRVNGSLALYFLLLAAAVLGLII